MDAGPVSTLRRLVDIHEPRHVILAAAVWELTQDRGDILARRLLSLSLARSLMHSLIVPHGRSQGGSLQTNRYIAV